MIDDLIRDLRHALRGLLANPLFTGVAMLALALGIGANTAIFSVMNAVVLRLLPVHDPARIFNLLCDGQPNGASNTGDSQTSFSVPVFERLRGQKRVFSDVMAYVPMGFSKIAVRAENVRQEASGEMVSGNYFSGLGVATACGRLILPSDERDHTQIAILSYRFWARNYGRDCQAVGKPIAIKGVPFTIAGVAEEGFIGLSGIATDIWVPLQNRPDFNAWGSSDTSYYASPNWWCLRLAARLAPGISREQAVAGINPIFQRAAYEPLGGKPHPGEQKTSLHLQQARGLGAYRDGYEKPLNILLVMVGVVLLIACGNVSLLLAARNTARRREFTIRVALGGSRWRLLRQLSAESFLLIGGGAFLGWLFALAATRALANWSGIEASLTPDTRVLLFTLAISLLACAVFGVSPLFGIADLSVAEALKTSAATAFQDTSRKRLGKVTAAIQVALCLMLVMGTVLLVTTLRNLETVKLGLSASSLFVFGVDPPLQAKSDATKIAFFRSLLVKLRSLPQVENASLASNRPGSGWSNNTSAALDGKPPKDFQSSAMRWNAVGPRFFATVGVPVAYGRDFDEGDGPNAAKVALVNQTFVHKYLNDRRALGHTVSFTPDLQFSVIGVVPDSKYTGVREEPQPMAYFPFEQLEGIGGMNVELRTYGDPKRLLPAVQKALSAFSPELAPLQPMTQQEQFAVSITTEKLIARLALFFGVIAVVLVATGLYGTIAYGVARRTSELGIRMALGAEQSQVLIMILKEGLLICLAGILLGLPLTFMASQSLQSLLFGLTPGDPVSALYAVAGILLMTLLACVIPARRASRISPVIALRNE